MNPNQCSKSSTSREYFVKQDKFQTTNELIPPGCFAQLMTELNGDDSVAAVFLSRTKMRGCIDANYPYPGGDEEKIEYQIVSKMGNDTFKVRVCQSVEGSLKVFVAKSLSDLSSATTGTRKNFSVCSQLKSLENFSPTVISAKPTKVKQLVSGNSLNMKIKVEN